MIFEDIKQRLNSNGITPVYISFMPPSSGIILYPYSGKKPDPKHNYDYYSVQIVTRMPTYVQAQTIAMQIYNLLEAFSGPLGNSDIVNCEAQQLPFQMQYDASNNIHFVQNFYIETVSQTTVRE